MREDEETEHFEIEVGARRYRLTFKRWPWKLSRRWVALLTKRALSLAAGGTGEGDVDAAALVDSFDEATFDRFFDDAEAYTVAIEVTPGVEAQAVPFQKITALLDGRADLPLRIARAHVELQLRPFFDSLPDVLGGIGPSPGATSHEASS